MKKDQQKPSPITDKFKLHLIELALHKLHEQLKNRDEFKGTTGDLIKLIEAHKVLQQADGPSEVLVRWIERERDAPVKSE